MLLQGVGALVFTNRYILRCDGRLAQGPFRRLPARKTRAVLLHLENFQPYVFRASISVTSWSTFLSGPQARLRTRLWTGLRLLLPLLARGHKKLKDLLSDIQPPPLALGDLPQNTSAH